MASCSMRDMLTVYQAQVTGLNWFHSTLICDDFIAGHHQQYTRIKRNSDGMGFGHSCLNVI